MIQLNPQNFDQDPIGDDQNIWFSDSLQDKWFLDLTQNKFSNENQEDPWFSAASKSCSLDDRNLWFLLSADGWFLNRDSNCIISGREIWFKDSDDVDYFFNKPTKRKKPDLSKIEIGFSKDPKLLQQYYDLREESYKQEWGFENYNGGENNFDKTGNTILAVVGNKVVGGMRILTSGKGPMSNEMPEHNFTYDNIARSQNIDLSNIIYNETSTVVIRKDLQDSKLLELMLSFMINECKKVGSKYIFGITTPVVCRKYKITLRKIGINSTIINTILAPLRPVYKNCEMVPLIVFL